MRHEEYQGAALSRVRDYALRAVSDGDCYAAAYVVERPNNPVEPFSTLLTGGFPSVEAALSEADTRARMFVDFLLDPPTGPDDALKQG